MADMNYLFGVLDKLSTRDVQFFDEMSEDELKNIHPLVLQRWLTGTSNKRQIYFLNEVANPYIFSLTKHKRLLLKLLMVGCSGKSQRYSWTKTLSKAGTSKPLSAKVVAEYFGYSMKDSIDALRFLTKSDILAMAEDLGHQHEDILKLRREYKDDGTDDKKSSKAKTKASGFEF